MDLGVVIPAFDAVDTLGEQLDALAAQRTELSWEVIVADNGSRDGTAALVRDRSADFPVPLRLADASARRGAASARNAGVREASAPLVAFCDADDVVGPGWVQAAAEALARHEVVMGRNRLLTDPFDPDSRVLNPSGTVGFGVQSNNFAIRRDVFEAVGGFDEDLPVYGQEDAELSLRLLEAGHRVAAAPEMTAWFRPTTGLRDRMVKVFRAGVAQRVMWHRHPERFAALLHPAVPALRLALYPVHTVQTALATRRLSLEAVARDGLTRAGHLWSQISWPGGRRRTRSSE